MSIMEERIEAAFIDEYNRIKHEGMDSLLEQKLGTLLYMAYRRGYIRGHSARSREIQQDEEQARREGKYPMGVDIKYDGNRLILDGKEVTPPRAKTSPPIEYKP